MRLTSIACWKSLRPNTAMSGSTMWNSFATTVRTPAKCPGRVAPSSGSAMGPGAMRTRSSVGYMACNSAANSESTHHPEHVAPIGPVPMRSEKHPFELQLHSELVCRLEHEKHTYVR